MPNMKFMNRLPSAICISFGQEDSYLEAKSETSGLLFNDGIQKEDR